jgi:4-alpha-glucanotransferase
MKLLQFAFGTDLQAHDFLPHNFPRRAVAYTGTHDNDTLVGWFEDPGGKGKTRARAQARAERRAALAYFGKDGREIHWDAIRCLWASVAGIAVVPMQDVLGLGSEARMNTPGTDRGNWEWRMRPGAFSARLRQRLAELTRTYERWPEPPQAEVRAPATGEPGEARA